ncbi:putative lipoprotein [Burkholderia cepacia GG4]|uniref:Lipoprotein n=1 Tax=Burkholderia cepacia GG4 TaxID=1009846 RepID=A0A9W3K9S0_BURCE|nr:putative lipoprotein [Burkholderia cepacia GG4]
MQRTVHVIRNGFAEIAQRAAFDVDEAVPVVVRERGPQLRRANRLSRAADQAPTRVESPSIQLSKSAVANATITLVTDDGIATLTFKTPSEGVVRDGTICVGKPDPVPAGVQADYIYEVKSYGAFDSMSDRRLTLNFTTDIIPDPNPPVVEMADVSGGTVTYKPTIARSIVPVRPNYSLAVAANFTGLYVVRLRQKGSATRDSCASPIRFQAILASSVCEISSCSHAIRPGP